MSNGDSTLRDSQMIEYDHLEAIYAGLPRVGIDRSLHRLAQMESEMAERELAEREEKLDGQAREYAKTKTHYPS